MRKVLVSLAKDNGIKLKITYVKAGKRELCNEANYAGVREFKLTTRIQKKLHRYLQKTILDIKEQTADFKGLDEFFLL